MLSEIILIKWNSINIMKNNFNKVSFKIVNTQYEYTIWIQQIDHKSFKNR